MGIIKTFKIFEGLLKPRDIKGRVEKLETKKQQLIDNECIPWSTDEVNHLKQILHKYTKCFSAGPIHLSNDNKIVSVSLYEELDPHFSDTTKDDLPCELNFELRIVHTHTTYLYYGTCKIDVDLTNYHKENTYHISDTFTSVEKIIHEISLITHYTFDDFLDFYNNPDE